MLFIVNKLKSQKTKRVLKEITVWIYTYKQAKFSKGQNCLLEEDNYEVIYKSGGRGSSF